MSSTDTASSRPATSGPRSDAAATIVVLGATGALGVRLVPLLRERGARVVVVTRRPDVARERLRIAEDAIVHGDATCPGEWSSAIDGAAGVVNLIGAGIGTGEATRTRFEERSRVRLDSAHQIAIAIEEARERPRALVAASSITYHAPGGRTPKDERSPAGDDATARHVLAWEREAARVTAFGVRVAAVRLAAMLTDDRHARALAGAIQAATPRAALATSRLTWVHPDDATAVLLRAVIDPDCRGGIETCAPAPVSHEAFLNAVARSLGRSDGSDSARAARSEVGRAFGCDRAVLPTRLRALGQTTRFPELVDALSSLRSARSASVARAAAARPDPSGDARLRESAPRATTAPNATGSAQHHAPPSNSRRSRSSASPEPLRTPEPSAAPEVGARADSPSRSEAAGTAEDPVPIRVIALPLSAFGSPVGATARESARRRGAGVVAISSLPLPFMLADLAACDDVRGIVAGDGACAWARSREGTGVEAGDIVHAAALPADLVGAIIAAARASVPECAAWVERGATLLRIGNGAIDSNEPTTRRLADSVATVESGSVLGRPSSRLLLAAPARRLERALEVVRERWWKARIVSIVELEPGLVAITTAGTDRVVALQHLLRRFGVPRRACAVLVNDRRDLGLVEIMPNRSAIAGAPLRVRAAAGAATDPGSFDAWIDGIERIASRSTG